MSSPIGAGVRSSLRPAAPLALCIGDSEPATPQPISLADGTDATPNTHPSSAASATAAAAGLAPRRPLPTHANAPLPPLAGLPSARVSGASRPSSPAAVSVSAQLHAAAPSPFAAARGSAAALPLHPHTHSHAHALPPLSGSACTSAAEGSNVTSAAAAAASTSEGEAPASAAAAVLEELRGASQCHGPLSSRLKPVGSGGFSGPGVSDPLRALRLDGLYSNDASLVTSGADHHIRFCHSTHATPKLASRAHYFATDGSVPVLFHDIRLVSAERLVLPVVLCAYTETAAEIRATLLDIAAMQSDMQNAGWPVELHVALVMDGWFRAPHSTKQYVRKLFQTPRQQTTAAAEFGGRGSPGVQYEDILSEWCSDSEARPPSSVHTLIVQKVSSAPVAMSNPLPGTADPQPLYAILPVDVAGDAHSQNAQSQAKRLKLTLIIKRDNRRKHNRSVHSPAHPRLFARAGHTPIIGKLAVCSACAHIYVFLCACVCAATSGSFAVSPRVTRRRTWSTATSWPS